MASFSLLRGTKVNVVINETVRNPKTNASEYRIIRMNITHFQWDVGTPGAFESGSGFLRICGMDEARNMHHIPWHKVLDITKRE